jgi:NADPH:quinone reductase-like Zn-dependent oxidoreductase
MKAIILKEQGGVQNFAFVSVPIPEIKPDQVLIKTRAVSINPADTIVRVNKQVKWVFGDDVPLILGWDISGEIIKLGSEVQNFKMGDEVFGVVSHPQTGKTYAEYVAAPASQLALKPTNITHEQAAVSTLAALTALQPIQKVGIKKGDRVFITAAGGGVGHFAVQLAKNYGAYVIALASGSKKDFVMSLGADEFIDYQTQRFEDVIKDVDLVIEAVKANGHILRSIEVLKSGGNLISLWSGITAEEATKAKQLNTNAFYNAVQASGENMNFIANLLKEGKLVPYVSKIFALEEMAEAHLEMEKGHTQGKIAIHINQSL